MRRFGWVITIPLTAIIILFAVMNRQEVALNLWPLPWDLSAPLFMLALGMVLLGFLIGIAAMWFSGAKQRRHNRHLRRDLEAAKAEIYAARTRAPDPRMAGTALAVTQTRLPPAA